MHLHPVRKLFVLVAENSSAAERGKGKERKSAREVEREGWM